MQEGTNILTKGALIAALETPIHLTVRDGDASLQFAYRKYKAYLEAQRLLDSKCVEGKWLGKKPTNTEVVELFVGKSMFYQYYRRGFGNINDFPKMVEWLEGGEGAPSDLEVWGMERSTYTFSDLFEYCEVHKDGKVKKGKKKDDGGENKADSKKKKGEDDDGPRKHKKGKKL